MLIVFNFVQKREIITYVIRTNKNKNFFKKLKFMC